MSGAPVLAGVLLAVRDSAREPTPAVLECTRLSLRQRAGRGALRLAGVWAAALFAVFIPLLHFILVPGLVLAAPIVAWIASKPTVRVTSPQVACPKCSQLTGIPAGTTGWPARFLCEHCGTTFLATLADSLRPKTRGEGS